MLDCTEVIINISSLKKFQSCLKDTPVTSGHDTGLGRCTSSPHNQNKDKNKFNKNKEPQQPEYGSVGKSNNKEFKRNIQSYLKDE